jgi:hypothetical protein
MRRRDARKLDHQTLEEIRIRAVEQAQAGESPEAVIKALAYRPVIQSCSVQEFDLFQLVQLAGLVTASSWGPS